MLMHGRNQCCKAIILQLKINKFLKKFLPPWRKEEPIERALWEEEADRQQSGTPEVSMVTMSWAQLCFLKG